MIIMCFALTCPRRGDVLCPMLAMVFLPMAVIGTKHMCCNTSSKDSGIISVVVPYLSIDSRTTYIIHAFRQRCRTSVESHYGPREGPVVGLFLAARIL